MLCLRPGPVLSGAGPRAAYLQQLAPALGRSAPKRKKGRPAGAASDIPIMLLFRLAAARAALAMLSSSPRPPGPGFPCLAFSGRGRGRLPWACYALEDPAPAGAGARQPWRARPPGSPGAPRRRYGQRPALRPALPRPAPGRGAPEGRRGAAPHPAPAIFPPGSARDFPP